MPAPTLRHLALQACVRNVESITDIGDMQYETVEPILQRISNPSQLRVIENHSPHIMANDHELWKKFIARDIPDWRSKIFEPQDGKSWWKVYRKLSIKEDKAKAANEADLQDAMAHAAQHKTQNHTQFVRAVIPHACRQTEYLDGHKNPNAGRMSTATRRDTGPGSQRPTTIMGRIRRSVVTHQQMMGKGPKPFISAQEMLARRQIKAVPAFIPADYYTQSQPQAKLGDKLQPNQQIHTVRRYDVEPGKIRVFGKTKPVDSQEQRLLEEAIRREQATSSQPLHLSPSLTLPSSAPQPRKRPHSEIRGGASSAATTTRSSAAFTNKSSAAETTKPSTATTKSSLTPTAAATLPTTTTQPPLTKSPPPLSRTPPHPVAPRRRPEVSIFMPQKRRKVN